MFLQLHVAIRTAQSPPPIDTGLEVFDGCHAGFVGQHFWARGFFVNTVGRDEEAIRAYIRNQEKEDQRLEQMNLWR